MLHMGCLPVRNLDEESGVVISFFLSRAIVLGHIQLQLTK